MLNSQNVVSPEQFAANRLFLRYSAQADRQYRRAVDEFDRLKALRPELPSGADLGYPASGSICVPDCVPTEPPNEPSTAAGLAGGVLTAFDQTNPTCALI